MSGRAPACGDCCTPPTIGFDMGGASVYESIIPECYPDMTSILNLASDVSSIGDCDLVLCGNPFPFPASSHKAMWFNAADWPAIKTYIEGGGRMWINAAGGAALVDAATLNSFLSSIGSAIACVGGSNYTTGACVNATAGAANIAAGLTQNMRLLNAAQITGGTNVWQTPGGVDVVQVEQLVDGFIFVCGDERAGRPNCNTGRDACEFFSRLISYSSASII